MRKIIMLSWVLCPLFFNACKSSTHQSEKNSAHFHAIDTGALAKGAQYYQCEMHPDQVSDTSGDCPVCGHELTTVEKK